MNRLIGLAIIVVVALAILLPISPVGAVTEVWQPALNTPWQWMIDHPLRLGNAKDMGLVAPDGTALKTPPPVMYDIDGWFNPASTVAALHAQGKKVVCYLDIGVYEDYRPDAWRFPASVIGRADGNWDGSWWLDIRRIDILGPIMRDRMLMCKDKGFDAIEPDEIDGYANRSGFPLTYADQLAYNRWIADTAHSLGLSIGLKGDIEQAVDLEPWFDWTLNEECWQYRECDYYDLGVFTRHNKAVFQVEYKTATSNFCPKDNARNWNGLRTRLNLAGGRWPCR